MSAETRLCEGSPAMSVSKYALLANERIKIEITAEDLAEISTWHPSDWKRGFGMILEAPLDAKLTAEVGRAKLVIRKSARRKKVAR